MALATLILIHFFFERVGQSIESFPGAGSLVSRFTNFL
jgi:hypothetical protein